MLVVFLAELGDPQQHEFAIAGELDPFQNQGLNLIAGYLECLDRRRGRLASGDVLVDIDPVARVGFVVIDDLDCQR